MKHNRDLGDHVLNDPHLNRALFKQAPDLGHEHAQHVGQPDMFGNVLQNAPLRRVSLSKRA